MPISRNDDWIAIAELDEHDQIRFTRAFQDVMADLGWEAKAFIGHLLGLWYDPFEHMLDYTSGEVTCSVDQPGRFDRNGLDEAQDVVEYWALDWSKHGNCHEPPHRAGTGLGLSVEWYRDVLRAKLVSLRLPRRLLLEYKEKLAQRLKDVDRCLEAPRTPHVEAPQKPTLDDVYAILGERYDSGHSDTAERHNEHQP